ncbi:MAG TPA: PEP-CTERM sorting domain-containing protein, partial [Burkholderiaceae bacterium]
SDYNVMSGSVYAGWGSARADRLGQLMSYVNANSQLVATKDESTSLQLAIWNVIYDQASDNSLTSGGFQAASGSFNAYANTLLSDSLNATNTYDVFVLTKAGSQDFMLLREKGSNVPEPSSVALAFAALGALGVASRRRGVPKA